MPSTETEGEGKEEGVKEEEGERKEEGKKWQKNVNYVSEYDGWRNGARNRHISVDILENVTQVVLTAICSSRKESPFDMCTLN